MAVASYEKKYETVVGSWYNSGFHGHSRSLPRNYYNTFREISKPSPPRKFSSRLQEGLFSHPFTKHDNKKTFSNDIDQLCAYGLRKDPERSAGRFNARFITWEKLHDPKRYMSCYRNDSRSAPLNLYVKDCMRDWEPLGNRMEFNTMYREHYCRRAASTHDQLRPKSSINSRASSGGEEGSSVTSSNIQKKKKRPYTTNLVPLPAVNRRERMMELRPEWMGNTTVHKQRYQSGSSVSGSEAGSTRRNSRVSMTSNELRDQGTNTAELE